MCNGTITVSSIIALLFGAFAILGTSFSPDVDDDQDGGDDGGTETDPIIVTDAADITGTDGDDVFQIDLAATDGLVGVTIASGAGDDTITLLDPSGADPADPNFEWDVVGGDIDGGDGNDTIIVTANNSAIAGGAGDDVIIVNEAHASMISSGDGDDTISGTQSASNRVFIAGGAGNDTIDAREMENVSAEGGEGNDTILVSGADQDGAAYRSSANGGEGADRFEIALILVGHFQLIPRCHQIALSFWSCSKFRTLTQTRIYWLSNAKALTTVSPLQIRGLKWMRSRPHLSCASSLRLSLHANSL